MRREASLTPQRPGEAPPPEGGLPRPRASATPGKRARLAWARDTRKGVPLGPGSSREDAGLGLACPQWAEDQCIARPPARRGTGLLRQVTPAPGCPPASGAPGPFPVERKAARFPGSPAQPCGLGRGRVPLGSRPAGLLGRAGGSACRPPATGSRGAPRTASAAGLGPRRFPVPGPAAHPAAPRQDPLGGLERELALQLQIAEAARRLCREENIGRQARRQRKRAVLQEELRLQELQRCLGERRRSSGPPPAALPLGRGEPAAHPRWARRPPASVRAATPPRLPPVSRLRAPLRFDVPNCLPN